jgi:hypothetical protein
VASSLFIVFGHFQFHLLPLDQKFFFHAVGNDPIAGMPTVMSVALRGVFSDPRQWIGAPWARPSIPNDLQFKSRML